MIVSQQGQKTTSPRPSVESWQYCTRYLYHVVKDGTPRQNIIARPLSVRINMGVDGIDSRFEHIAVRCSWNCMTDLSSPSHTMLGISTIGPVRCDHCRTASKQFHTTSTTTLANTPHLTSHQPSSRKKTRSLTLSIARSNSSLA